MEELPRLSPIAEEVYHPLSRLRGALHEFHSNKFFLEGFTNGSIDIFVQKLDPLGNFEWAKQMGGTNHEWGILSCTEYKTES